MWQQFFHDEIVVNLPGKFPSVFNRFQFLVAFDLQINISKKEKKENKQNEYISFLQLFNRKEQSNISSTVASTQAQNLLVWENQSFLFLPPCSSFSCASNHNLPLPGQNLWSVRVNIRHEHEKPIQSRNSFLF
jgi:hypothetical protein